MNDVRLNSYQLMFSLKVIAAVFLINISTSFVVAEEVSLLPKSDLQFEQKEESPIEAIVNDKLTPLELAITNNLFLQFPEKPEGELTDIRSALVRGTNLASVAKNQELPEYLLLGK